MVTARPCTFASPCTINARASRSRTLWASHSVDKLLVPKAAQPGLGTKSTACANDGVSYSTTFMILTSIPMAQKIPTKNSTKDHCFWSASQFCRA